MVRANNNKCKKEKNIWLGILEIKHFYSKTKKI